MKTWYKLTMEETTRIYCLPAKIVNDSHNHFWGLSYHPQEFLEGNWPLLILSNNDEYPFVVTLQIHTLPMELLHEMDFEDGLENFNPLEIAKGGGSLILSIEQFKELCNILRAQRHLFANAEPLATDQPVFQLLGDNEIRTYRLHPEWFSGVQRSFYAQTVYPVTTVTRSVTSLISIGILGKRKIAFKIMTFAKDDLLDETFTPLLRSGPQLYLNWQGLLELVDILLRAVNQAS